MVAGDPEDAAPIRNSILPYYLRVVWQNIIPHRIRTVLIAVNQPNIDSNNIWCVVLYHRS